MVVVVTMLVMDWFLWICTECKISHFCCITTLFNWTRREQQSCSSRKLSGAQNGEGLVGVAGPAGATNQSGFGHQRLCSDAGSCPALIGPHLSTVPTDENAARPFSRKAANLSVWTRADVKPVFMPPNVNLNLVNLDHRQSFEAVAFVVLFDWPLRVFHQWHVHLFVPSFLLSDLHTFLRRVNK